MQLMFWLIKIRAGISVAVYQCERSSPCTNRKCFNDAWRDIVEHACERGLPWSMEVEYSEGGVLILFLYINLITLRVCA